jgi:hypothetical protein
VFAVDCAADAAELADETPVSTYNLVAASAELLGAARFVNACEPMLMPPVIVPPAFGNAALAVDCAELAVDCAAVAVEDAALAVEVAAAASEIACVASDCAAAASETPWLAVD